MRAPLRRRRGGALLLITHRPWRVTGAVRARGQPGRHQQRRRDGTVRRPGCWTSETIPAGAKLGDSSVTVTVDGAQVPVTVRTGSTVTTTASQPRRVAMLVVDTSGSMAGAPLAAVKTAAQSFLGQVPADVRVGLVAFSDTVRVLVPATLDRATVKARIATLQAAGGTALYDAMRIGQGQLGTSGERLDASS